MREQTTPTKPEQPEKAAPLLAWVNPHLSPQLWRLLSCVWGRGHVGHTEVTSRVWGQPVKRLTLDVAVCRLNRKLKSLNFPVRLHVRRFDVYVEMGVIWG